MYKSNSHFLHGILAVAVLGALFVGACAVLQPLLVSQPAHIAAVAGLVEEDEGSNGQAERYPVAEGYSSEAESAFASVMHIDDGTGQELTLADLPTGSYSGFMFSLADAAMGSGDTSTYAQQAVEQGLIKQVHGSLYEVDSLDTLAGLFTADQLEYVEPDYRMYTTGNIDEEGAISALSAQGGTSTNPAPTYPPSDPRYLAGDLWHLDMLNVEGAWELGLDGDAYIYNSSAVRDSEVRVAVIDTGFYGTGEGEAQHEDFNYDHVVDTSNFITSAEGAPDAQGHGTFVSGLIAAQVNNGVGVAGLTPGVYIVPCKVFDTGSASTSDIVEAIYYATDEAHVDVINMSLGGEYNDSSLQAACDYAEAQGVIVVASAGNDGVSTPNYPAAYDSVVGVASVDSSKTRSSWSQYGKSVFVTAPGESVTSTYMGASNAYKTASGTSFSGPEVAALAAMCKAVYPDMTEDVFKEFLIETSTDLGTEGFDDYYGYGLVNFAAMAQAVLASQTLPWYTMTFAVTTTEGAPIAGATVTLTAAEDISWDDNPEEGIEAGSIAAGTVIAPEADGTFRVHRGVYNYAVNADGYYLTTGTIKTYAEKQQVDVQMEESFDVTLKVQDGNGTALAGVHLAVMNAAGRTETAERSNVGVYHYDLMSGIYSFTAATESGYEKAQGSFEVQRDDRELTITLYESAQLSTVDFSAQDAESGEGLTTIATAVYDDQGVLVAKQADGTYRLARGVAYKAIVTRLGYEDAIKTFTVDDAETMTVDVALIPAECMVTFRAVTEAGEAVLGATVTVTDAQGVVKNPSATNAMRYNLKAGSYTYSISAPGYETVSAAFSVSVESRTLTVVMSGIPQSVTFAITDAATGEELADASVKVTFATSTTAIRANADGSFSLAPGEYRYSVYCLNHQSARGAFTVEGEALSIPVALEPYSQGTEGFAGGSGTVDDPYLIATEDQLRYLAQQTDIIRAQSTSAATNQKAAVAGYYQLVSDITLTSAWLPIGNYENGSNFVAFAGNFDGAGHTISGLRTTEADYSAQGLFGCVQNATISNLTVEGSVVGDSYVGGIVGTVRFYYDESYSDWNTGSTRIENCVSRVAVTGRYAVGGIVGSSQGSSSASNDYGTVVSECANYGVIHAAYQGEFTRRASCAGGIVGSAGNCKVEYCYNRATVEAGYNAGGLVGQSLGLCGLYNSYNTGLVYEHVAGSGYAGTSGSIAGRLVKSDVSTCYGLVPADRSAVNVTIGQIDAYTTVAQYGLLDRAGMWRNADFLATLNTDALTDVVSATFVMGASFPVLKSEVAADELLAEEPFIVSHPLSPESSYQVGEEATALVATVETPADGGALTWQWYEVVDAESGSLAPVEDAAGTGATATFVPSTEIVGTRSYLVRFTNTVSADGRTGFSSVDSDCASVVVRSTVDAQEPEITAFNPTSAQQINTTVSAKVTTDVLLSVEATVADGGTLSYQWYKSSSMAGKGSAIPGAMEPTYQPDTTMLGTVYYYVEVTNTYEPGNIASVKSPWVAVVVNEYTISSYEELLSFRTAVNSGVDFEGLVVTLTCDLDVSDESWEPIGTLEHPFRGTFRGGITSGAGDITVHTVGGIRVDGSSFGSDNVGFFGVVESAMLSNLVVEGSVSGAENRYAGLLVGRALSSSTSSTLVENCATSADSSVEGKYCIGGLVGYGAVKVKDCANHGTVTGRAFVPTAEDKSLDSYSYITKAVGGVVGYASTDYVQGCYNTGAVSVDAIDAAAGQKCAYYVGGVVGSGANTAAVVSCFDTGTVSAGTKAERAITYKPAGVCYEGAVVGYQVYDQLYNVHYLDGACSVGTNSTVGYDYAENHTLAFMKTAFFLGQLHDGYGYGDAFAQSTNGVPHLAWETDTTEGDPLTDAAEPYLYNITIDGVDDILDTWGTYFYQGEQAPAIVVWAKQVQPDGGHLTYQWEQRGVGEDDDAWTAIEGAAGECVADDGVFTASLQLSTETVGAAEFRCVITNTLDGATGIASASNDIPAITIDIRENIGTFALRDSSAANSVDNPWVITTADQLHFLALLTNGETKMVGVKDASFYHQYVSLEADLDISGFETWEPIGSGDGYSGQPFEGFFDGNGHAITGLQIGTSDETAGVGDYQALFGSVYSGSVRNLCVSGVVNMSAGSWITAGIVGYAYGSALENLANHVDVTGSVRVGGVAGTIGTCQVKDCVNTGTITVADATSTSNYGVGGIVGYAFDAITPDGAGLYNCLNLGSVSCALAYGTDPRFGAVLGEVGSGNVPLSNCYYVAGSATCLNNGSAATGRGNSKGYVEDELGVVEAIASASDARIAWQLNTAAGTVANSERWGVSSGDTSLVGLTMCGAEPIYRVDTTSVAAQFTVSDEYVRAGQTVEVSWRNKPGFVVTGVKYGLAGADEAMFASVENGGSFVMPASDVVFAVEYEQDGRYRYNLYASVVDEAGAACDKATIAFDELYGEEPTACEGDEVVATITLAEGYQVRSATAAGLFGTNVSLMRVDGLTYSFVMPADLVRVTVVVEPEGTPVDKQAASLAITRDNVHIYNADDAYHTGNLLYGTIALSGTLSGDNEYFVAYSLENAANTPKLYEQVYTVNGEAHRITGISVAELIRQFADDRTQLADDTPITFETTSGESFAYTWAEIVSLSYNAYPDDTAQPITRGLPVLLAFGEDGAPYADNAIHLVFGQTSANDDNGSRLLTDVTRIVVGEDVNYAQHSYGTYSDLSKVGGSDVVVNIYQGDELVAAKTYTVKDVEAMANADRGGIYRGLYSVLICEDNETNYSGPYSDYYEGYSLYDVLLDAGLPATAAVDNPAARVQFYQKGEWSDAWKTVNVSLGYLAGNGPGGVGDYSGNYTMYGREDGVETEGVEIDGMAPTLAYGKNNLPLVYSSGTTGASATAYNYRGPLIALLPQNDIEGGYVAEQSVSACYLGQIDVRLPEVEKTFVVSDGSYTEKSGMRLVTYCGEVPEGKNVVVAGKTMFAGEGDQPQCLLEEGVAASLTNESFAVVDGAASTFTRGDANGNGVINILDAQIAYDLATGFYDGFTVLGEGGWLACDMNQDGFVDAADALAIQRSLHQK